MDRLHDLNQPIEQWQTLFQGIHSLVLDDKEEEASDQCYKVESITFGDDGLVELTGSYAELTADGKLAMLQNWSNSNTLIFTEGN